jgi:colanic acid/amylovoran biosynthesis glycosyltransferase
MRIRRIGYVINIFPKLSETFIAVEMAELRRRGVDLKIVSLRQPTETLFHPMIKAAGLINEVVYDPTDHLSTLKEFRPDLLHAHFATEPTAAARDYARQLSIPFTFTAHGYDIHRKPPEDFRARAEEARAIITVSNSNATYIEKTFGVGPGKIHVIPCGVDTEFFKPASEKNARQPIIICVARHVVVKNLRLLLQAFAHLQKEKVSFQAVLIGDGPCRSELESLCKDLELEKRVKFIGAATQDQVLPWLQRAHISVLSSQNEGMPVSLMEAAACGLPVVATAVGGIPELVRDGETGFLSPLEPISFAEKLRTLLDDPALAENMGRAARLHAIRNFSVQKQIDSMLNVWHSVVTP